MGRYRGDRGTAHRGGGGAGTVRYPHRDGAPRRRHPVERRTQRGCARGRFTGDGVRRPKCDAERLGAGDALHLGDHAASGAARQGSHRRRHGVAAAARSRSRRLHRRRHAVVVPHVRRRVDVGAADRRIRRPAGPGERAAEFGCRVGRPVFVLGARAPESCLGPGRGTAGDVAAARARGGAGPRRRRGAVLEADRVAQTRSRRTGVAAHPRCVRASRSARHRACRSRQGDAGPRGPCRPERRRTGRSDGGSAGVRGAVTTRHRRRGQAPARPGRPADHRSRRPAALRAGTGVDADPRRAAQGSGHPGRRLRRDDRAPRCARRPHPRSGRVRPRADDSPPGRSDASSPARADAAAGPDGHARPRRDRVAGTRFRRGRPCRAGAGGGDPRGVAGQCRR